MKKCLSLIILICFFLNVEGADKFPGDSIYSATLKSKVSVDSLLKQTNILSHTDSENFKSIINEILGHSAKTKNKKLEALAYHLFGTYFENNLQMDSSFICLNKAKVIQEEIGDSVGLIRTYFGFGNRYDVKGTPDSALHYYYKALDIAEKRNDSLNVGYSFMGIGNILSDNKQKEKAKEIYRSSLVYFKATSEIAMSWIYNNLGSLYLQQDSIDKALVLFKQSLEIKNKHGDWYGILFTNNNIGAILLERKNQPIKALEYFMKSLDVGKKEGVEKEQIGLSYLKVGSAYNYMKKYPLALSYQDSSLQIAEELNSLGMIARNYLLQSKIYKGMKNYSKANESLSNYVLYNDSLLSEQSLQQINQLEAQYQNEKKELEISNLEKDKKTQQAEIKQQEAENLLYLTGLGLAIILIVFVSIAFFQKRKANILIQKQKDEIEIQKEIVEEKNSEILDSITYAKRIQNSILPPQKIVKEYLQNSFILYKPKDIVAGDFYWMEQKEGKVLFAAADCTGHGVPGAMVSVICHNALNKAVQEFKLSAPADILNKVEQLVKESFSDLDENVNDGMDIALCSLNYSSKELQYAGANNPLWLIRNNTKEIEITRADKQGIGGVRDKKSFTNHTIQLQNGDSLYIFSDGFADQFGGPKGKKIMRKNFKQMIIDNVEKSAHEQKDILNQSFENWKGELEQIDDVCIIGVRI